MSKKVNNSIPTERNGADLGEIPYGKPARVGNFKLWRSRKAIGKGKDRYEIEQINVSTLDDEWQIKIPATYDMFFMIRRLFAETVTDDEELSKRRISQLSTFFCNMLYVSQTPNGYLHRAYTICAMLYANPSMLREDDENHEDLMQDVKGLISRFLEWRKEYDVRMTAIDADDEMANGQVAEEMVKEAGKDPENKEKK